MIVRSGNKKGRVLLVMVTVAGLQMLPQPAYSSGIPTVDVANLVEQFSGHIQDAKNWAEEKVLAKIENRINGDLTGMVVDNANNAAANVVVRLGRVAQDIQEKELQQDVLPDFDACKTGGVQTAMRETGNSVRSAKSKDTNELASKYQDFSSRSGMRTKQEAVEKELLAKCESIKGQDGTSTCVRGDLLLGSTGDVYNGDEAIATGVLVELLAGPEVATADKDLMSATDGERLNSRRQVAIKRLVQESLNEVRYNRMSVNGRPSQLQIINHFVDQRFGTPEGEQFLKVISNTHPNKNSNPVYQTTPEQVLRKMAVMDAFLVYMEALKYKQQQRTLALTAALLALEAKPLVYDTDPPGGR